MAIGFFIASLAPGYWWLVILLAIAVMGDAAWHPIATGVLTQKMPDRRARALGIHAMGGTIGAEAVAPLAVGVLLVWFDWRTVLQISVLPALVMGVAFIPMVRRNRPLARPIVSTREASWRCCDAGAAPSGSGSSVSR